MSQLTSRVTSLLQVAMSFGLIFASCAQAVRSNGIGDAIQVFHERVHLPTRLQVHRFAGMPSLFDPNLGHLPLLETNTKPKQSSQMSTVFHVYTHKKSTRNIRFRGELTAARMANREFQFDLTQLAASDFNATRSRTIVMIGGFLTGDEHMFQVLARKAWLRLFGSDVNVICVGWPDSNGPIYEQAVANTVLVARQITIFLHYLARLSGTSLHEQKFLDSLHVIGHSLGAHIAGFVGKDLGGRMARITGLDPAGPQFYANSPERRLDRSDAQLVEALHTNAGQMTSMGDFRSGIQRALASLMVKAQKGDMGPWFGIDRNVGHVDYYANNGRTQEGCADPSHICDHSRAHQLYVDILRYEAERAAVSSRQEKDLLKRDHPKTDSRLWAFRADDYDEFQSGVNFEKFCPQLVAAETHLSAVQVNSTTFGQCAVPLLDFVTPTSELIRELRDNFHISFDAEAKSEDQSKFYFKTRMNSEDNSKFVADQYLLNVYLDQRARGLSLWDPRKCTFTAKLKMSDGSQMELEMSKLNTNLNTLSIPFAHPAGQEAHAQLLELLKLFAKTPANGNDDEQFLKLFQKLFPNKISLQYGIETLVTPRRISKSPSCQLAIQQVEVVPLVGLGAASENNLGALYGQEAQEMALSSGARHQLKLVSTRELSKKLANFGKSDKLAQHNNHKHELALESVLLASSS